MPRKDATQEELEELWNSACTYWEELNAIGGMIPHPWAEQRFKTNIFIMQVRMKGFRIPPTLGGMLYHPSR